MNNIPTSIFLSVDADDHKTDDFRELDCELVYWSSKRQDISDLEFINAKEVEKLFNENEALLSNLKLIIDEVQLKCPEILVYLDFTQKWFNKKKPILPHHKM